MAELHSIGFEIEGGWDGIPLVKPFTDGTTFTTDGSINGQSIGSAVPIRAVHVGEAISRPIPVEKEEVWTAWIRDHWPNAAPVNRTNRTCGFHIHLSTRSDVDYVSLTKRSFLFSLRDLFVKLGEEKQINPKHIFWERMKGLNNFCALDFDAMAQMKVRKEQRHNNRVRYGWLNFAKTAHGTVELRCLPTFRDSSLAVFFTKAYVDFVKDYLSKADPKDLAHFKSF